MSPSATRYYAQEYPLLGATGNGLRVTAGRSISPGCSQTVGQRDRQPFIFEPEPSLEPPARELVFTRMRHE